MAWGHHVPTIVKNNPKQSRVRRSGSPARDPVTVQFRLDGVKYGSVEKRHVFARIYFTSMVDLTDVSAVFEKVIEGDR